MPYQIRISDAAGEYIVAGADLHGCELIVKSYIHTLLQVELADPNHGLDAADYKRAAAVLADLASDLSLGQMHRMNLDKLVHFLWDECCWQTGPNGDPSFTIEREVL
jgi:hypothetical protein